mgnify:CR=1 FL=1
MRSRVEWIEEGEKPSKYFCNLESQNFISKQITKLERDILIDLSNSEEHYNV